MSASSTTSDVQSKRDMTTRTLGSLFALAFGLTWGLGALMVLFTDQIEAIFGEISLANPYFILMVYAPGLAGVFLVWRHFGLDGLRSFFRRLNLRRMPAAWWLFLVVGIPVIVYAGAVLSGTIDDGFPFSPWHGVLPALGLALATGPLEEFGWRGLALPLLQRRFAPLWSGLILGGVWGLWHVPSFFASGTPQSSWSIAPFLIGLLAVSVIMTPLFNVSRGSLLIAALFHFQVMNPVFPDAQPWDTLFYVIAAVIVVVLNRHTMLTREGAVTEILMPEEGHLSDRAASEELIGVGGR